MFRRFDVLTFQARRGFSMVELLISIMILGIGLVMVATIFPVGLDMTRETVQQSLGLAATDSALDIIKLKLPTWHDEIVNETQWTLATPPHPVVATGLMSSPALLHRQLVLPTDWVLAGNPYLTAEYGIENDAKLDTNPNEWTLRGLTMPPNVLSVTGPVGLNSLPAADQSYVVYHTQAFTELSFWNGDTAPNQGTAVAAYSFVLRGQNVPVNYAVRATNRDISAPILMTERAPVIVNGLRSVLLDNKTNLVAQYEAPARLSLTEHVYPSLAPNTLVLEALRQSVSLPIQWEAQYLIAADCAGLPIPFTPALPASTPLPEGRRYSWACIYRPIPAAKPAVAITVLALTRGEKSSQFARQGDNRQPALSDLLGDLKFNLADPMTSDWLTLPRPTLSAELNAAPNIDPNNFVPDYADTYFPRPWLVALGLPAGMTDLKWPFTINGSTGEALCTAEVAMLIPSNSYIVLAMDYGGGNPAGKPIRVLNSEWDRSELGRTPQSSQRPARLTLDRTANLPTTGAPVFIWVYPPAIQRGGGDTYEFGARSPVVAAFQREVTLP